MSILRRQFLLGSLAMPAFAAKPVVRPNLLLFVVDNLPAWMLGCYGNQEVRTPNLNRLAQTGARFSNHFACSPAPALGRATLMTGRTPMQLGDAETPALTGGTLDKMLAGAGYATGTAEIGSAGEFLDQQAAGKPFFLAVSCAKLTPPYDGVAQKYRDLYAKSKFDTLNLNPRPAANAREGKDMLSDIIGNVRKVAAAVTALDDEVGAVIARPSAKRLLDSTAVIFTASCGSLFGRHGLWDAGQASDPVNMYDEVMATPMIWSWLGRVPAQAVRPEMVSAYDLVPTVCELASIAAPANLCGRSYLPLVTGKPLPKKRPWPTMVFGHYHNTDMAREDHYKLVLRDGGKGPGELYDFTKDKFERDSQYANQQYLTVRSALSQALDNWKRRYSA